MSQGNANPDVWTIGRLIAWTTEYLGRQGSESPRLDSEILLGHALGWPRVKLYMNINEDVGETGRSTFRDLVRKRAAGEPVAYLVGHKEFYSLDFEVSPDVLIPRPDTETLVMAFLELAKAVDDPLCVDVGTGSGCVAIACAKHHRSARFVAIDISDKAVAIARKNVEKHALGSRIEVRGGSLLDPLRPDERPAFIVSNPPYIPTKDIETLDATVRDYEPTTALDGGYDGLVTIRELANRSVDKLAPGGYLLIEIGHDQAESVEKEFGSDGRWTFQGVRKDLAGVPRVLVLKKN
jgi:release factor glutamine methyltransferase